MLDEYSLRKMGILHKATASSLRNLSKIEERSHSFSFTILSLYFALRKFSYRVGGCLVLVGATSVIGEAITTAIRLWKATLKWQFLDEISLRNT